MEKKDLKKYKLPDAPGVYFFRGSKKKILYIGKATSLRDRVRSYFVGGIEKTRSVLISEMVDKSVSVDFEQTDSALEALILEAHLIKKHEPWYNSREKDNKSFNHLLITNEEYPRLLLVRGRELDKKFKPEDIKYLFGPFPQGGLLKDALKIVRKIFPFFDTRRSLSSYKTNKQKSSLSFNRQIGLYPAEDITVKEYAKTIKNIALLFEGKKKVLIAKLEREMKSLAKKQLFEEAEIVKRKIFALQHIQDVSLIRDEFKKPNIEQEKNVRIEAYDIAHFAGHATVGVMTVVENGEINKNEYRKFNIKSEEKINDTAHLAEIVDRRLAHPEWDMPNIIVVDGGKAQKNAVAKVLERVGVAIPLVSVVKDEKHMPRGILGDKNIIRANEKDILLANYESHRFAISFHRNKRRKI